jgi:SAM-dependent methyltransferase
VAEVLFDLSAEYRQMLHQGIRLSGESQEFFIQGRLRSLLSHLPRNFKVRRILDFGCGIGTAAPHLAAMFSGADVVGVDTSEKALEHAAEHHGSDRVRFRRLEELDHESDFDLCHVNGVFHHIQVESRAGAIAGIRRALRAGGRLALFENNPWNPGARMVMKRIPFDRDAVTLSPPEAIRLVRNAGFSGPTLRWSLFYFPRPLAFLRFTEGALSHLPLGAQYCVLAAKSPRPC